METVLSLRALEVGRESLSMRKFMLTKLSLNAQLFYQSFGIDADSVEESSLAKTLTEVFKECIRSPLRP